MAQAMTYFFRLFLNVNCCRAEERSIPTKHNPNEMVRSSA